MSNHFKFVSLGSLITTFASYVGFYTLVRDQKIFISSYLEALSITFVMFFCLSIFIWSMGLLLMQIILKFRSDLTRLKTFFISVTLFTLLGMILYLLFRITIMDMPFNPWLFIFPGIPLLSAFIVGPFLLKLCYKH